MSEIINGNGTIPQATAPFDATAPVPAAGLDISSSTNATPIVVTTSSPHGYSTGDTVFIEGHKVNTNANGRWAITVTGGSTFSLNGSVGNGVGVATGYVQDFSVNPLLTIPDDGDNAVVSSINPAIEGLFNLAPFFYERVGKFRLYNKWANSNLAPSPVSNFSSPAALTVPNGSVWTDFTGMTDLLSPDVAGHLPVMQPGDVLDVIFACGYRVTYGTGITSGIAMSLAISIDGAARAALSDNAKLLNMTGATATSQEMAGSLLLHMSYYPVVTGTYNFGLQAFGTATAGTNTISLASAWNFIVNHYRPN